MKPELHPDAAQNFNEKAQVGLLRASAQSTTLVLWSRFSGVERVWIKPHLPAPESQGSLRVHPPREILDATSYIVRGGCAWRLGLVRRQLVRPAVSRR